MKVLIIVLIILAAIIAHLYCQIYNIKKHSIYNKVKCFSDIKYNDVRIAIHDCQYLMKKERKERDEKRISDVLFTLNNSQEVFIKAYFNEKSLKLNNREYKIINNNKTLLIENTLKTIPIENIANSNEEHLEYELDYWIEKLA